MQYDLLKPNVYDPFCIIFAQYIGSGLPTYRDNTSNTYKAVDLNSKSFTDKELQYLKTLIQQQIKPNYKTIENLFENELEDLHILLTKYPTLSPSICSAIAKMENRMPFIPILIKHGTQDDMRTLLLEYPRINVVEMLSKDHISALDQSDLQPLSDKLQFPAPDDEQNIKTLVQHGNPFIALLAAKKGIIAKEKIPQLLKQHTHGLLSTNLKRSLPFIPLFEEETKPVSDYYKHLVQCQIDLADDEKTSIDLQKLEKKILEQRSYYSQQYGNALLFGMGKVISLLHNKVSSYFARTKNNTNNRQEEPNKKFISSLHFSNDVEKNEYYNAMQSALLNCKPLNTANHYNSPYFSLYNGLRFSDYDCCRGNCTPITIKHIKDLRPIENLILSKTPWYERHGNKIFGLYCGLLAAGIVCTYLEINMFCWRITKYDPQYRASNGSYTKNYSMDLLYRNRKIFLKVNN